MKIIKLHFAGNHSDEIFVNPEKIVTMRRILWISQFKKSDGEYERLNYTAVKLSGDDKLVEIDIEETPEQIIELIKGE